MSIFSYSAGAFYESSYWEDFRVLIGELEIFAHHVSVGYRQTFFSADIADI